MNTSFGSRSRRSIFLALAEHDVVDRALAIRLASASDLRNLIAHQYGVVDWRRVYGVIEQRALTRGA